MAIEVKVPQVGESITEVEIGEWLKAEGDTVNEDEDLVVIESEKATVEVAAPQSGRLSRVLKNSGETAHVGEVIALLELQADTTATAAPKQETPRSPSASAEKGPKPIRDKTKKPAKASGSTASTASADPAGAKENTSTRDAMHETAESTDAEEARKEADIESPQPVQSDQATSTRGKTAEEPPRSSGSVIIKFKDDDRPADERPDPETRDQAIARDRQSLRGGGERVVPMTPLRRRIAERLVQAQQTSALLTTFNEIDMTAVIDLRRRYQDQFKEKHEIKLGFMSFFVRAVVHALKLIPAVNAEIRGAEIVYHDYFDIGVAVGSGKGLVVPVLRDAEHMSFAQIEHAISDFAQRAQDGKLKPDDLQGGTFTISNGGIYGSLLSTPIINPPQSGILGMHAIEDRPVARDGAVVIKPMMYVALTYDHRIIDGREAVTFLKHVKNTIEEPLQMLLEL